MAALAAHPSLKHCVVVDEDINIFDPEDIEYAIATRVKGDDDILIIPKARGSSLDPWWPLFRPRMRGMSRVVWTPCARNTGVTTIFSAPSAASLFIAWGMEGLFMFMKPTSTMLSSFFL